MQSPRSQRSRWAGPAESCTRTCLYSPDTAVSTCFETDPRRIFFSALAQGLQAHHNNANTLSPALWAAALASALEKLYTYTRARPPSRTLVDPLDAFVHKMSASQGADLKSAVEGAAAAALGTRDLEAKAGRSAYVEGDILKNERVPDPGAWGVKAILEGFVGSS